MNDYQGDCKMCANKFIRNKGSWENKHGNSDFIACHS